MPWTTPKTWADQELVTAELLNAHLRDNFRYLVGEMPFALGMKIGSSNTTSQVFVDMDGVNLKPTIDIKGTRIFALCTFRVAVDNLAAGCQMEMGLDGAVFTGALGTWTQNQYVTTYTYAKLYEGLTPGSHYVTPRMRSTVAATANFYFTYVSIAIWGL